MAATTSGTSAAAEQRRQNIRRAISGQDQDEQDYEFDFSNVPERLSMPEVPYDSTLEYNGKRSLSSIAVQAFWIGVGFAVGLVFAIQFSLQGHLIWRFFAFATCLAVFHFLEFWTTARFNLPTARANSFLLFTNGAAYNVAYGLAILEILLSTFVFTGYAQRLTSIWSKAAGALLVILGQSIRSLAMAQAGTNFNHIPQKTKKEGHVLVTTGIYAWLRHPSYFGFFWWALGTQLLVGNKLCVLGYAFVLWTFFYRRIVAEERLLVEFFGEDYVRYRSSTSTGIPFVR